MDGFTRNTRRKRPSLFYRALHVLAGALVALAASSILHSNVRWYQTGQDKLTTTRSPVVHDQDGRILGYGSQSLGAALVDEWERLDADGTWLVQPRATSPCVSRTARPAPRPTYCRRVPHEHASRYKCQHRWHTALTGRVQPHSRSPTRRPTPWASPSSRSAF